MAKFISKSVEVNAPLSEVHSYLQNMSNIQRLLPLDKISNWSNTEDSCSFKIQNYKQKAMKLQIKTSDLSKIF
jgi:carbon monoxide dehydrogenase subunit G